jgi:hypothetical protein
VILKDTSGKFGKSGAAPVTISRRALLATGALLPVAAPAKAQQPAQPPSIRVFVRRSRRYPTDDVPPL